MWAGVWVWVWDSSRDNGLVYIVQKRTRMSSAGGLQARGRRRPCGPPSAAWGPTSARNKQHTAAVQRWLTYLCVVVDHVDQAVCIQPHIQVAHDHPARAGQGRTEAGRQRHNGGGFSQTFCSCRNTAGTASQQSSVQKPRPAAGHPTAAACPRRLLTWCARACGAPGPPGRPRTLGS